MEVLKHKINAENTDKWFIVLCKANYVKKIALQLSKFQIETYYPVIKELRIWHDRKKWIEIPAFGSYLFVKASERERLKVFEVKGIVKYLQSEGKPTNISEQEIENLKKIFSFEGNIEVCEEKLEIGDQIEILDGFFHGFKGQLLQKNNNKQLKIALKEIGYSISIDIMHCQVKKL